MEKMFCENDWRSDKTYPHPHPPIMVLLNYHLSPLLIHSRLHPVPRGEKISFWSFLFGTHFKSVRKIVKGICIFSMTFSLNIINLFLIQPRVCHRKMLQLWVIWNQYRWFQSLFIKIHSWYSDADWKIKFSTSFRTESCLFKGDVDFSQIETTLFLGVDQFSVQNIDLSLMKPKLCKYLWSWRYVQLVCPALSSINEGHC